MICLFAELLSHCFILTFPARLVDFIKISQVRKDSFIPDLQLFFKQLFNLHNSFLRQLVGVDVLYFPLRYCHSVLILVILAGVILTAIRRELRRSGPASPNRFK